ncbi:serine hydrolase domain-containing protein [Oceanobacillus halophilus]|uniref:Class A beta-lactamase-related serine hydrolase n=1 Tax=Oceanobacillus halophilus TaxID=930130 RepID=A0A495A0E3_9BACI|nr:serine hydrolase domain-containing protein [Oceanobacillus halophilus]RKQ32525.1 class A beta-lactamase-related serine hydrolase [Oceanobacillus halophilus]
MNHKKYFTKVTTFIDKAVQDGLLPGAVAGVVTPNEMPYVHYSGYAHFKKRIYMKENTIFDVASLTKVATTLPAILKLLEDGELDLDDPVYVYVPAFKEYQSDVTIRHLLCHTSGFQPGINFYLDGTSMDEAIIRISERKDKKEVDSEVIYSDLNFITLGYIVEKITGMSLDQYVEEIIYQPLGMKDTCFNPSSKRLNQIAATEFMESIQDYQWGKVHDENANHFGGVSGHAGLFTTLHDLVKFSRMILNDGRYNGQRILSKQTLDLSREIQTEGLKLSRGLGWQLYDTPSFSGQFLQNGFGHTGFTGTSLWFDADKNFAIILLTNRVHFGRQTDIARFRRITHNLISLAMEEFQEVDQND